MTYARVVAWLLFEERLPVADIGPAHARYHGRRSDGPFDERAVDRLVFDLGEGSDRRMKQLTLFATLRDRLTNKFGDIGAVSCQLEIGPFLKHKDASDPSDIPIGEKRLRKFAVGILDKAAYHMTGVTALSRSI